jgi:hypothetical protein
MRKQIRILTLCLGLVVTAPSFAHTGHQIVEMSVNVTSAVRSGNTAKIQLSFHAFGDDVEEIHAISSDAGVVSNLDQVILVQPGADDLSHSFTLSSTQPLPAVFTLTLDFGMVAQGRC